jgi:hypothetical protein
VGLIIVFLISFVPYYALWIYIIYTKNVYVHYGMISDVTVLSNGTLRYPYLISTCFLLINSCIKPIALFYRGSPFRKHLKRYLTSFCRRNSPPTGIELRIRN